MALLDPAGWFEQRTDHNASQLRTYVSMLTTGSKVLGAVRPRFGVHPHWGDQMEVLQTGTPSMAVQVGSGGAIITGEESSSQGGYFALNDAALTVAVATAHASLPRIDIVQIHARDANYSGTNNDVVIDIKQGTPAASPVAPAVDVNAILLAEVLVPAAATSITNSNITDKRVFFAATGGVIRNRSETPVPATVKAGQLWWADDTKVLKVYDGSSHQTVWSSKLPLGIVKHGWRVSAKTGISAESGVLRIDSIPIVANKLYRIWCPTFRPYSTIGTDTFKAQIRYNTSGTATTSSTILIGAENQSHRSVTVGATYAVSVTQTLSIILTLRLAVGTGVFSTDGEPVVELLVEDLGYTGLVNNGVTL